MKRSKVWVVIIFICIVVFVIAWLVVNVKKAIIANNAASHEDLPGTYALTSFDSGLISKGYRNKFTVVEVLQSKVRNPISIITIEDKYQLLMYKIDLKKPLPLNSLLHFKEESVQRSTGYSYSIIGNNLSFLFQKEAGKRQAAESIYMTLAGDSTKAIESNDSVLNYNLLCKNISVRYKEQAPIDIYLVGRERPLGFTDIFSLNFMLLSRGDGVYLFLLTPKESNFLTDDKILSRIVNRSN